MKKMLVVALLITLGLSVAAPAVQFAQWKVAVANEDAALTYVRTGVQPTQITTLPAMKYLDADAFVGFDYVAYIAGFLTPPQDGEYSFYTASDDDSGLWLSPDENIANAVKIAALRGWSPADAWLTGGSATRTSGKRTLKAGQKYAFCMTFRNGAAGGTNGSAGWMGPGIGDGKTITVIAGEYVQDSTADAVVFGAAKGASALLGKSATVSASGISFYPWTFTYEVFNAAGDVKVADGASYTVAAVTDADQGNYYVKAGASKSANAFLDVTHGLIHRYTFNEDAVEDNMVIKDVVGGEAFDAFLYGMSGKDKFTDGKLVFGNSGQTSTANTGSYVDLPNDMITQGCQTQLTVEAWYTQLSNRNGWARLFDFGTSQNGEDTSVSGNATTYIMLAPRDGSGNYVCGTHAAIAGNERQIRSTPNRPIPLNQEVALTFVWDEVAGLSKMYYNGVIVGRNLLNFKLVDLVNNNNWIGRSQWPDAYIEGAINEFRIWDTALAANEIARHALVGPEDTSLAGPVDPNACPIKTVGDENGDCVLDFVDYAMMVERWMMDVAVLQ